MHAFTTTVRGRDLDVIETELFQLRDDLEAQYGKPVYFPFFQYRPGEIRAQQGYLAKFPAELLDLLPELSSVRTETGGDITVEEPEDSVQPSEAWPRAASPASRTLSSAPPLRPRRGPGHRAL